MQPHRMPFSQVGDGFVSATSHESTSRKITHEGDVLSLNNTQKDNNVRGPEVVSYGNPHVEDSKITGIEGGAGDIQLPEEDSLITVSDTVSSISTNSYTFENAHKREELLPENKNVEDLNDKFLIAVFRDGDPLTTHIPDGLTRQQKSPLEMIDSNDLYHHLQSRPSSHIPHQMDQTRPLFPPLEHHAHMNPQMKFTGPDGMHHEPNHPFPGNLIPHHGFTNICAQRFDRAASHHPMLRNMPIQGNFSPHHPVHNMPRGVPSSHTINHVPGYMHEMNSMHNFPLHNRQPNFGGDLGMGFPGPPVGGGVGTHPEALQRLIEMEMRANSKQIHAPAGIHFPGLYGPENMNLRYR